MPMLPTLRTLLELPRLGLSLLTGDGPAVDGAVEWVHSSDLADPTPFVAAGQLLLTTGTQFAATDPADYVARLAAHGLAGLGFGTEVISTTPAALVAAARAHGLPLVEVPYRTPFIAVARANAELIAADANERQAWSLGAQRAISLAALRPDGLRAALAELARALGRGVALFDASGQLDRVFPSDAIPSLALGAVRRDVARLLSRGQRASDTVTAGGIDLTLHTLGARGRLRGVLAVGGGPLDDAARGVVASVVGLASLALEQGREQARATGRIRTALLRALLSGEIAMPAQVATELWGGLPDGPVRLALIETGARDGLDDALEARASASPDRLFFARLDNRFVALLAARAEPILAELVEGFQARIGVSSPVSLDELPSADAQARRALAEAPASGIVRFDELPGILTVLRGADAAAFAQASLAPLREHDRRHGTELVATLAAWLDADARFERAAEALGVHRHTVRARIVAVEKLLDRDLSRFAVRAELWAALTAL